MRSEAESRLHSNIIRSGVPRQSGQRSVGAAPAFVKNIIIRNLPALMAFFILPLASCSCGNRHGIETTPPKDAENTARGRLAVESITHNQIERTYRIYLPASFNKAKSLPLLIALHGGGGTGENMIKLTRGGFNDLADKEGFIPVYPDALERQWNDGRSGVKYRSYEIGQVDDTGFISALIGHLIEEYNIDKTRVYATGISNGAIMSYRLGCELTGKIAAIAPVAGQMVPAIFGKALPTKPLPVLIINNTTDPCIQWEGGEIGLPGAGQGKRGIGISVPESVRFWVEHDKCATPPAITILEDKDPGDGTRVRKEAYSQGVEGTEVILYAVEGGGHTWPGGYQYLRERVIGKTSRDIDANEVIWNFCKNFKRKSE